jgi:two-component system chemotaxis response regulator CheB
MAAMEAGAVEFVAKPTALALEKMYTIRQDLTQAVIAAASIPPEILEQLASTPSATLPVMEIPEKLEKEGRIDAVVIGISTGGPRALRSMIPRFPAKMPIPVLIALLMPAGYTQLLAEQLNNLSQVEVLESADNLACKPGRVILAQAGMHTRLLRIGDGRVVTVVSDEPNDSIYCPSVDVLFRSAAETYHDRVLAVVMTGMGNDGTNGAGWIKAQGGLIFAESEETSVVFGMPRSVIEAGLADRIVPLHRLPEAIMEVIK